MRYAGFSHSPCPSHHDGLPTCAARRATLRCRRICSDETSDVDPEPFASPCAWSLDLFRCESMSLRRHWVLVVMDHYTRRIIGFGIHAGVVNGEALCHMFKQAIRGVTA